MQEDTDTLAYATGAITTILSLKLILQALLVVIITRKRNRVEMVKKEVKLEVCIIELFFELLIAC